MSRMIFVTLPVANLTKSGAFLESLGAVNEPEFTRPTAAKASIRLFPAPKRPAALLIRGRNRIMAPSMQRPLTLEETHHAG